MCNHATICGGLKSGRLKQEFRELELLNEITRLRWIDDLKEGVGGNTRSTLLKSYMKVYGYKRSCPENVHPAVKWGSPGEIDPLNIDYDDDPGFVWKDVDKAKRDPNAIGKKATGQEGDKKGAEAVNRRKRKAAAMGTDMQARTDIIRPPKKQRTVPKQLLRGLRWRQQTQTCAYDSLLSILSNVYWHNAHKWGDTMSGVNMLLGKLVARW
ncbi:hypothetical protein PENSPDRAFT_592971, partial [Peniophora sp. CONT]